MLNKKSEVDSANASTFLFPIVKYLDVQQKKS